MPVLHQAPREHGGKLGALDSEIAEAVLIVVALRTGAAITHGTLAMKGI